MLMFGNNKLYWDKPNVGVVIGTFGSTAFVKLQLESLRVFNPGTPVLIHDDCSSRLKELTKLSKAYDAELHYSSIKSACSSVGDLCVFVQGLIWAEAKKIDILVKISRRWVTLKPWVEKLQELAINTQSPTYSGYCTSHRFGFRTEVIGMGVKSWYESGFIEDAISVIKKGSIGELAEAYIHRWAQKICVERNCLYNKRLMSILPIDKPFGGCMRGYIVWSHMIGESKTKKKPYQLWYETNSTKEYVEEAAKLGLNIKAEEFLLD